MASYTAELLWQREGQDFLSKHYSRRHPIRFDGGVEMPHSSSPHVVPLPWSDAAAVDPEEAFVAALASCHMLWFLPIAAKRGFCVEPYEDAAEGVMARNAEGRMAVARCGRRCCSQASPCPHRDRSWTCTTPRTRSASLPIPSRVRFVTNLCWPRTVMVDCGTFLWNPFTQS